MYGFNIYIFTFLLLAAVYYIQALDKNSTKILTDCQKKHKVSNDVVKGIATWNKVSDDPKTNCMNACWLKGMNFLKDGQIQREIVSKWNRDNFITDDARNKAEEGTDLCIYASKSKEECKLAYELVSCFVKFVKDNKLNQYEFIPK